MEYWKRMLEPLDTNKMENLDDVFAPSEGLSVQAVNPEETRKAGEGQNKEAQFKRMMSMQAVKPGEVASQSLASRIARQVGLEEKMADAQKSYNSGFFHSVLMGPPTEGTEKEENGLKMKGTMKIWRIAMYD